MLFSSKYLLVCLYPIFIKKITCLSYIRMIDMNYRINQCIAIINSIMRRFHSGNWTFNVIDSPFGIVALCVVKFSVHTEHESSDFFDSNSVAEKIASVLIEEELDVFQRKTVIHYFQFWARKLLFFFKEKRKLCTVLGLY